MGGSECFPFLSPFEPFEKLLKPFPVVEYSFPGKGKDLSPFEKLLKPFPVANLSWERKGPFPVATFPGKGKDLSQLTPFLGKDGTFNNMNKVDLLL